MFNPKNISVLAPVDPRSGGGACPPPRRAGQTGQANRYAANYRDSARVASSGSSPCGQSPYH
jgi:hypothetical protein